MLRILLLTCLAFSVTMPPALAGPFPLVVLENDQRQTGEKSKSSASRNSLKIQIIRNAIKLKRAIHCSKLSINITPMPGWTGIFWNLPLSKPIGGHLFAITQIFYMPAAFCTCHR